MKLSNTVVSTQGVPYDTGSIMHYGAHSFSRNGEPTIEPRPGVPRSRMGQRIKLTSQDLQHINKLYGCDQSEGINGIAMPAQSHAASCQILQCFQYSHFGTQFPLSFMQLFCHACLYIVMAPIRPIRLYFASRITVDCNFLALMNTTPQDLSVLVW